VGGTYKGNRTFSENVKLSGPLLSRFDLIYVLLDNPADRDDMIAQHVVAMHTSGGNVPGLNVGQQRDMRGNVTDPNARFGERYKQRSSAAVETRLTRVNLRKYIAYAKHYIHPKLSREACGVIQQYYLVKRRDTKRDGAPTTTRVLESLMRLSVARCKAELRVVVTGEDARDVVELMEDSLSEVEARGSGIRGLGVGARLSSKKRAFVIELQRLAMSTGSQFFTRSALRAVGVAVGLEDQLAFESFIEMVNDTGYILKKPGGYVLQQP
jgi:DNA helicase MCM8